MPAPSTRTNLPSELDQSHPPLHRWTGLGKNRALEVSKELRRLLVSRRYQLRRIHPLRAHLTVNPLTHPRFVRIHGKKKTVFEPPKNRKMGEKGK
jgi:hypothetical protein